jgi:hypothetical protein
VLYFKFLLTAHWYTQNIYIYIFIFFFFFLFYTSFFSFTAITITKYVYIYFYDIAGAFWKKNIVIAGKKFFFFLLFFTQMNVEEIYLFLLFACFNLNPLAVYFYFYSISLYKCCFLFLSNALNYVLIIWVVAQYLKLFLYLFTHSLTHWLQNALQYNLCSLKSNISGFTDSHCPNNVLSVE